MEPLTTVPVTDRLSGLITVIIEQKKTHCRTNGFVSVYPANVELVMGPTACFDPAQTLLQMSFGVRKTYELRAGHLLRIPVVRMTSPPSTTTDHGSKK